MSSMSADEAAPRRNPMSDPEINFRRELEDCAKLLIGRKNGVALQAEIKALVLRLLAKYVPADKFELTVEGDGLRVFVRTRNRTGSYGR
jgi:hypothetical protein